MDNRKANIFKTLFLLNERDMVLKELKHQNPFEKINGSSFFNSHVLTNRAEESAKEILWWAIHQKKEKILFHNSIHRISKIRNEDEGKFFLIIDSENEVIGIFNKIVIKKTTAMDFSL